MYLNNLDKQFEQCVTSKNITQYLDEGTAWYFYLPTLIIIPWLL